MELFVLHELQPHPSGGGKPMYFPLDCGIANYLGASTIRRLQVWLITERMAKNASSAEKKRSFYYYRSSRKKIAHLVEETIDEGTLVFQLFDKERILKTDAELLEAFLDKNKKARAYALAPVRHIQKIKRIEFRPWEDGLTLDPR
jgi:hypothetical protein